MSFNESALFQQAVMQSWNAVVITSADAALGYPVEVANPAFCQMTGYSLDELKGHSLKRLQGPDTDPHVLAELRTCLAQQRYFEGMTVNYRKDGTPYLVRWNISPVRDDAGTVTHYVSVQQDQSEHVQSELQNRLLARALDASSDPILVTDLGAKIIFANQAFADITGYSADELIGKTPSLLRSGRHEPSFYTAMYDTLARGESYRATFTNRHRDGSIYFAEQSITPIKDEHGQISHYVSVSKDITTLIQREERLREAAIRDPLTGLHNRRYGEQQLDQICQAAPQSRAPTSIIIGDIDDFKGINDRFGHPTGDRVLVAVAQILRQHVRSSDVLIRWGGEEFLILLHHCTLDHAADLAERIRARVEAHRDEAVGTVTLSLGVAALRDHESITALVGRADAALYTAKRDGKNKIALSDPLRPPESGNAHT